MQGQDLLSAWIDHWGLYSFGVSLQGCISITKMQNASGANDTQFSTAEIYGQKVSWLIPLNHLIALSELNRRIASLTRFFKKQTKSKFKNPHTICLVLKVIFVDSEPPVVPLNLTCPSCWQKGSI